jgi:hypothetical protein
MRSVCSVLVIFFRLMSLFPEVPSFDIGVAAKSLNISEEQLTAFAEDMPLEMKKAFLHHYKKTPPAWDKINELFSTGWFAQHSGNYQSLSLSNDDILLATVETVFDDPSKPKLARFINLKA